MRLATITLFVLLASGCATASKAHMAKMQREGEALRVDLAETYVDKGAYDAAVPMLTRALAANPRDTRARLLYATVLRERGLYAQAEREYREVLRQAPRSARAWDGLGVLLDLRHKSTAALAAHRKAVALAPGQAAYWNNYGFSLLVAGRPAEAVPVLEHALALDPELAQAWGNLGFAYGRSGDLVNAERCFEQAGSDGEVLLNLALVYEEQGDRGKAHELRAEAADVDPELAADWAADAEVE